MNIKIGDIGLTCSIGEEQILKVKNTLLKEVF